MYASMQASEPKHPLMDELLARRPEFLAFLERRVRDRAIAEDVLHDALARALTSGSPLRDPQALTAWFYQIMRNVLIDHSRRVGARERAHGGAALETPDTVEAEADRATACKCVTQLAGELDAKLAQAIQRVDVDGVSIAAYAEELGITPNNARVRLHRGRAALRADVRSSCGSCADTGCADCTCVGA